MNNVTKNNWADFETSNICPLPSWPPQENPTCNGLELIYSGLESGLVSDTPTCNLIGLVLRFEPEVLTRTIFQQ